MINKAAFTLECVYDSAFDTFSDKKYFILYLQAQETQMMTLRGQQVYIEKDHQILVAKTTVNLSEEELAEEEVNDV